jgi:hypothetical protein
MAKIRCHYDDCAFLDEGYCSAALIELDPDKGCLTYVANAEVDNEETWEEEPEEDTGKWEDFEEDEEETPDDDWEEDDEEPDES